jgi:hypothetical protein
MALDPEHPVRIAPGSDTGGGNALSIVRVLEEAYKVVLLSGHQRILRLGH